MAPVSVRGLTVTYNRGKTVAASAQNFDVKNGEFFVLLGPSGCGKTTVLHCIAGLIQPDSGEIKIGDVVSTSVKKRIYVAPQDRKIAMVFQEYALYPNMTVKSNLSFPLENAGVEKKEIEKRVKETADVLGLGDLLNRKPAELSGGQRQRVALGRALIRKPKAFLLDEPLGNLDAKLRLRMRFELKKLQKTLGITTVYVTHDQTEAMTMADRIMLMKDGKTIQLGTTDELFSHPKNLFVAGFIGVPPMNLINCTVTGKNRKLQFSGKGVTMPVPPKMVSKLKKYVGKEVVVGTRPQYIVESKSSKYQIAGKVEGMEPLGDCVLVHATVEDLRLTAQLEKTDKKTGDRIVFSIAPDRIHVFDRKSGDVIITAGG